MNRGVWKTDDDDRGNGQKIDQNHKFNPTLWVDLYTKVKSANLPAVYIDIEKDEDDDEFKEYSRWCDLPDLLLEKIFSYLNIREKYYSSLVCKSWYRAFHLPYVWSRFVLEDSTLTRGRFNYYSGWQYVLDHLRTQMCLSSVGKNFRHLTFEPMLNFYNLYEFMNMVSWYIEQSKKSTQPEIVGVGSKIRTLKFTFPCDMATRDETERIRLFGTGGKLLAALKRLMANLKNLKKLELIDLMLDAKEAEHLLDEVCEKCCLTLRTLILINTTRIEYQVLHVGVFLNLQVLVISPQNLGNDVVELIGYTKLRHLHIMQNRYTPDELAIKPASDKVWKACRINNPDLSVHLEVESKIHKALLFQPCAPVKSIIFDSPNIGVEKDNIITITELYKNDITVFGHKNLPRGYRSKSFYDRADCSLLLLCGLCPKITTLIVTERISTATVLLIAHTAKHLQYLFIRRNAVLKRCDWPHSPQWTNEFYEWIKTHSRSYELVEDEVSKILHFKWRMLTDKEFQKLCLDVHNLQ